MGVYDNYERMSDDLKERVDKGIGCGSYVLEGWATIINTLNDEIAAIDPDYKVDQIKEKFGGLRYYVHLSKDLTEPQVDAIRQLIDEAEGETMQTCDVCGAPGKCATQGRGYIATRCEEHSEKKS